MHSLPLRALWSARIGLLVAFLAAGGLWGCGNKGGESGGVGQAGGGEGKAGASSGETGRTGEQKAANQAAPRAEKDARVFHRNLSEPEFIDPGLVAETEGARVVHDTFEGLYFAGPNHNTWTPGVAEGHTVSEDGLTWTYKLRPDSVWSDGKPLTAHDFEWAWKRVLDPKTGSRYGSIMWCIAGARAYNENTDEAKAAELREQVGVRAIDDHTLEVKLAGPTPYFNTLVSRYTFAPVPRHVVEAHGKAWVKAEHWVSNGPWVLKEWSSHQQIVLEKNEKYRDQAAIPFDRVVYHIAQENEPLYRMYEAGQLDFLEAALPPRVTPRLIREKHPDLKSTSFLGVYYYMYNVKKAPLQDARVRRALSMAIDKEKIGKFVVKGGQQPANTLIMPHFDKLGYSPPEGEEFDPDLARKLLAEAGFAEGKGIPTLKISYNTLEGNRLIAEFIQQQWKKNLSVESELENMEWKVLLKRQHEQDFVVTRSGWIGDYMDPMTFLELFETDHDQNNTGWSNAEFDKLIASARQEPDAAKRYGLMTQAEAILVKEMPALPLYFYIRHDLVKPWVKGYETHLQALHLTRHFKVAQ